MGYVFLIFTYRLVKRSLIIGWIISKFCKNILWATRNCMGYVIFIFRHSVHVCERECANTRVVKRSLIFGRILSKFGKNILRVMTTIYMGYELTLHAYVSSSLDVFSPNLMGIILQTLRRYVGYLICVGLHVLTARICIPLRIVNIWSTNVAKTVTGKN
jgi:hypothetical protein